MNGLNRRPFVLNAPDLASFFSDAIVLGNRTFENLVTPHRVTTHKDGNQTVAVDLAGFTKEDIVVSVDETEKLLVIEASVKQDDVENSTEETVPEVEHGFYNRKVKLRYSLPENTDYDQISSDYTNGVLKVDIAIKTPVKVEPRKIAVS